MARGDHAPHSVVDRRCVHDLNVSRDRFIALGLNATTLNEGLLEEIRDIANKYSYRADTTKIIARSVWTQGMETSPDLVN